MSNTKNTVKRQSCNESKTVFWTPPLSSEISESLSQKVTPRHIGDWLRSLPPASLVSRFRLPASVKVKQTKGICGLPLCKLSKSSDRKEPIWRTCQDSLLQDTTEQSFEGFPKSDMMQNGRVYPLAFEDF